MAIAGLIGGTGGAIVLLNTPQMTFLHLVPWLLLVAAVIFALSGPVSRWLERRKSHRNPAPQTAKCINPTWWRCSSGTIAVCFYIGYFGAGAGFLIITLLSLFGYQDLNEINALKVVCTTMANGIAFVIFVFERPGRLALLPGGHDHLRHRRIHFREPRSKNPSSQFCAEPWCSSVSAWRPTSSGEDDSRIRTSPCRLIPC